MNSIAFEDCLRSDCRICSVVVDVAGKRQRTAYDNVKAEDSDDCCYRRRCILVNKQFGRSQETADKELFCCVENSKIWLP